MISPLIFDLTRTTRRLYLSGEWTKMQAQEEMLLLAVGESDQTKESLLILAEEANIERFLRMGTNYEARKRNT